MYKSSDFFDLSHTIARDALEKNEPHAVLSRLDEVILELIQSLDSSEYIRCSENVLISRYAEIDSDASIGERVIIGHGARVRKGALIRGDAIIGEGATIGNSCEIKSSIIFDGAQIPHFNYVGNSIVGYRAHLGAGAIASNLRLDGRSVPVRLDGAVIDSGMRKLGALIGDFAEIGCNAVLCPGAVIERGARIMPLSCVHGYVRGDFY